MRIAAVVVTFNRVDMLKQCLQGLRAQSTPVDHIFIVNNASSDGTREYLDAEFGDDPTITLNHLPTNTGGAGGFHTGLKLAKKPGYDWYWLMDDDVVPRPDCLEILLRYRQQSECIHPRKQHLDGSYFNWYGHFNPKSGRLKPLSEDGRWEGQETLEVNYGCFEGMLVSDRVVGKVGLPASEYFICYDDRIYGYLASKETKVIYVRDAVMDKLIKKPAGGYSAFSFFYQIRNLFLLKRDLKKTNDICSILWVSYLTFFVARNVAKFIFKYPSSIKIATKAIREGASFI